MGWMEQKRMMMGMQQPTLQRMFSVWVLFLLLRTAHAQQQQRGKVKVFLLAGQSNMVGFGSLDQLMDLAHRQPNEFGAVVRNGKFVERKDVYYHWKTPRGALEPGKNGDDEQTTFGPEVGMGWVLGDAIEETVVLIKSAYGGLALSVDFRPPSSGGTSLSNDAYPSYDYGWYYEHMVNEYRYALQNLEQTYPDYDWRQGYEIAGFAWFQGWNDMMDANKVKEYGFNLSNLIKDLRRDLNVPNLPVVIGELGMHGPHPVGNGMDRIMGVREAQQWVAELPEFRATTRFVPTAQYALSNEKRSSDIAHYYGRADVYFRIGRAMGQAMQELLVVNNSNNAAVPNDSFTVRDGDSHHHASKQKLAQDTGRGDLTRHRRRVRGR